MTKAENETLRDRFTIEIQRRPDPRGRSWARRRLNRTTAPGQSWSEIVGCESCPPRNLGQDPRPELSPIVEGPRVVGPAFAFKHSMGAAAVTLHAPTDAEQGAQDNRRPGRGPVTHRAG